ncbi:MAG: CBS domain-containing protein [Chloroflexi bacterium]|nr:MAG: CBS domain-containing protein [Chloroflexota bacterium]
MLVKEYMTRHPLLVEPDMSIVDAQCYMGKNNVRHLPVVGDGKRLLGLVTRQRFLVDPHTLGSLDVWEIARALSGLTVKDVMIKARDVVTVDPDLTIEEAAYRMVDKKVGCLPVLEGDVVVGMLSEVDLLAHLAEMMGSRWRGVRVTVRMPDQKGEFAKMVAAISARGWGITAMGGVPTIKDPTSWDAVVKIRFVSPDEVVAALEKVEGHQIIDVRET